MPSLRRDPVVLSVVVVLVVTAVVLVGGTLSAPDVPTFAPTSPAPVEVGAEKVGPRLVTVDASAQDAWAFFDLSRGSVVAAPDRAGWDLAFRRHRIIVNGGPGFAGRGGVQRLSAAHFDSVAVAPEDGYESTRADSVNAVLERWYDYSWTSHLLEPKPAVYALRTADGRYAKFEIVGYYCPGAIAGCLTIRYVYQGGDGVDVGTP